MNIREFKKALPFLLKHNICPFLWGSQGVGKTQTLKQYCKENELQLVTLYTATQEVGDLIGLLIKDNDGQTVKHARPKWFPTEGKGIIFLDELNRAPNDVLQAMFAFILEGKMHTHQLPPDWKIVAAGNYQSDKFTVTDTSDAAWMSRFCHIDFTPTTEEWIVHADSKGMGSITSFIREQPSMLEVTAKEGGRLDTSFITPDRRAWTEGVGKLDTDSEVPEELRYELYSGLVGIAAASAYVSFLKKREKSITLDQILGRYTGSVRDKVLKISDNKKDVNFSVLNQPIDELFVKLEANSGLLSANMFLENLKQYLLDIPKELSMKAFIKLQNVTSFHGKNELLNDPEYVGKFKL